MGFFSSNCESCHHPLLPIQATNDINKWMNEAVAITSNGSILKGEYSGYGAVGDFEHALDDSTVWHNACWEQAGSPVAYTGASAPAGDQGWFFEDGAHDLAEPGPRR